MPRNDPVFRLPLHKIRIVNGGITERDVEVLFNDDIGWVAQDAEQDNLLLPTLPRTLTPRTTTPVHVIHIRRRGSTAGPSTTAGPEPSFSVPAPVAIASVQASSPAPPFIYSPLPFPINGSPAPVNTAPAHTPSSTPSSLRAPSTVLPLWQAVHSRKSNAKLVTPRSWPLDSLHDMLPTGYRVLASPDDTQRVAIIQQLVPSSRDLSSSSLSRFRRDYSDFVTTGELERVLGDYAGAKSWKEVMAGMKLQSLSIFSLHYSVH